MVDDWAGLYRKSRSIRQHSNIREITGVDVSRGYNENKKTLTLDLIDSEGQILRELILDRSKVAELGVSLIEWLLSQEPLTEVHKKATEGVERVSSIDIFKSYVG